VKRLCLIACIFLLAGCGHRWKSDQYGDSAEANRALAATKKLCQDYARETQALNFGFDRVSRVDQPLEEAVNTMDRQNLYFSCMKDHGWERY